jgi:hypothetical protein
MTKQIILVGSNFGIQPFIWDLSNCLISLLRIWPGMTTFSHPHEAQRITFDQSSPNGWKLQLVIP